MASQKQRKSKYLEVLELLRAQLKAPQSSNSDNLVGEVDVLPSGNPSVFLESEDGVDSSVKEPEISSGSLDVVVAASELIEAVPGASNSELELPQFDCATAQVDLGGEVDAGDVLPDAGDIVASSESSASADEDSDDDESLKFGDLSCPTEESYYFVPAPSESISKRFGRKVSRHDIAFVRGVPRLMSL